MRDAKMCSPRASTISVRFQLWFFELVTGTDVDENLLPFLELNAVSY